MVAVRSRISGSVAFADRKVEAGLTGDVCRSSAPLVASSVGVRRIAVGPDPYRHLAIEGSADQRLAVAGGRRGSLAVAARA